MADTRARDSILGIEGGGSKTTWIVLGSAGETRAQGTVGPGNTLLLSDGAIEKLLQQVRRGSGARISSIGAAFAGCQLEEEKKRIAQVIRRVWPRATQVVVMEDTRSVLAAAFGDGPGIVVIAGTGSNVAGQKSVHEPIEKVGGWGHLFSDEGSAYDIVRRGLKVAYATYDSKRVVSRLAREFLDATESRSMEELIRFMLQDPGKTAVAKWAPCVFAAAEKGDPDASAVLDQGATRLAAQTSTLERRLGMAHLRVALTGGIFEHRPEYVRAFQQALKKHAPGVDSFLLTTPGVVGAARLAGLQDKPLVIQTSKNGAATSAPSKPVSDPARLAAFANAATEQRNPRSRGLDRLSIADLVDLFIKEERYVEKALAAQREPITQAAALVARKLAAGGRLFYIGAGTSGRLGVVDASEMPPTFNAPPEQIQAIIAGGPAAVFRSQEGAEDSRESGVSELQARRLAKGDIVCGIAASGQTPFVLSALEYARKIGAATILLSCNPNRAFRVPVNVAIDLPTGPELVTGSTRLKAGTATKLVLNMLSTIGMVRTGRVRDNLMINVQATNDKLRARAVRLVQALAKGTEQDAQAALEMSAWRVSAAIEKLAQSRKP